MSDELFASRQEEIMFQQRKKERETIELLEKLKKQGRQVDSMLEYLKRPKKEIRVDIITG